MDATYCFSSGSYERTAILAPEIKFLQPVFSKTTLCDPHHIRSVPNAAPHKSSSRRRKRRRTVVLTNTIVINKLGTEEEKKNSKKSRKFAKSFYSRKRL